MRKRLVLANLTATRLTFFLAIALLGAACGGGDEASPNATTTSTAPTATTSPAAATTTTSPTPDSTTTTPDASSGANFVLWNISLGPLSQVIVQNIGDGPGSLAGYWLCQRPSYYAFPDVELQPGELAAVAVTGRDEIFGPPSFAIAIEGIADIGTFDPTSGEVGLYLGNDFDNPDAIVSYVEWGSSGHGRSQTAVSAQIWPDGGFVETSEETGAISATVLPPTDPTHWTDGG